MPKTTITACEPVYLRNEIFVEARKKVKKPKVRLEMRKKRRVDRFIEAKVRDAMDFLNDTLFREMFLFGRSRIEPIPLEGMVSADFEPMDKESSGR